MKTERIENVAIRTTGLTAVTADRNGRVRSIVMLCSRTIYSDKTLKKENYIVSMTSVVRGNVLSRSEQVLFFDFRAFRRPPCRTRNVFAFTAPSTTTRTAHRYDPARLAVTRVRRVFVVEGKNAVAAAAGRARVRTLLTSRGASVVGFPSDESSDRRRSANRGRTKAFVRAGTYTFFRR